MMSLDPISSDAAQAFIECAAGLDPKKREELSLALTSSPNEKFEDPEVVLNLLSNVSELQIQNLEGIDKELAKFARGFFRQRSL